MDATDVIIMLNARRGERSWKAFAEEIGVRPDHLAHIMAGRRAVRGRVLEYLGLKVEEVYVPRFSGGGRPNLPKFYDKGVK